jgi:hypothetical protein
MIDKYNKTKAVADPGRRRYKQAHHSGLQS